MTSQPSLPPDLQKKVREKVTSVVSSVLLEKEQELDDSIERLNDLTKEELENIRKKRLEDLKKRVELKEKWTKCNHGKMILLPDQNEFFNNVKSSKYVICHFFNKSNKWCNLLREHLTLLARKHIECKFCEIDCENATYLMSKLNIWMLPTLVLAKNNKVDRQLIGLDWVAPNGKINTLKLEEKLFEYGFFEETILGLENKLKKEKELIKKQQKESDESDLDI